MTSTGGVTASPQKLPPPPYQHLDHQLTCMHTQMPAPPSALGSMYIQGQWRVWYLQLGWNTDRRDIGWAESVGFELLTHALLCIVQPGSALLVYGDNQGVIEAWHCGRSRNRHINHLFKQLVPELICTNCDVVTWYVPSRGNPTDPLSRSFFPSLSLLLPPIDLPGELNQFLIDPPGLAAAADAVHA